MRFEEIPDQQKRLCISCSSKGMVYSSSYTQQKPVGVRIYQSPSRRSIRGPIKDIEWRWECLDCGEVQA